MWSVTYQVQLMSTLQGLFYNYAPHYFYSTITFSQIIRVLSKQHQEREVHNKNAMMNDFCSKNALADFREDVLEKIASEIVLDNTMNLTRTDVQRPALNSSGLTQAVSSYSHYSIIALIQMRNRDSITD